MKGAVGCAGQTGSGRAGDAASVAAGLRGGFQGRVFLPADDGYDEQRAALRPGLDSRPLVVAEAGHKADVRAAVLAARREGVPVAVQSTGHGTLVPADGAVLIKTSAMAAVMVDPARRVARAAAGARWRDVIAAASPLGLAPLSGSSPAVGVSGYTLGGGLSWLSRKYGLAADSLLRAGVVTADGEMLTASRGRNADLFWALRGGGGSFGVVTSLEFRLYPVSRLYGGVTYYPIERAADVLGRYRDVAPGHPDELSTTIVLMARAPEGAGIPGPVVAIRGLYAGDPGDGPQALRSLLRAAGPPLRDGFRPMSYLDATAIGGTAQPQFQLFHRLPDAVIEAAADLVARQDTPVSTVEVRHWGGAMARPGPDAGPAGHRDVPFSVGINGPAAAAVPLARRSTGGSFLNFLADPARTADAYTAPDYLRLREIKRRYDPGNVFRLGHNIPPAPGQRPGHSARPSTGGADR